MKNLFNASRLKEARLLRRITIEELADKAGITKQSISQFENNKCIPELGTIQTIASTLDFPMRFFFESSAAVNVGNTYFRALYSCNKKDLNSQRLKTKYVVELRHALEDLIRFKPLNLPAITEQSDIEEIALAVRKAWGLGVAPIANMVALLEMNGIIVTQFATDGSSIDAFTQYDEIEDRYYYCTVIGTEKDSFYRKQFSCAHELGHILLHERYQDLDEVTKEVYRKREDEANAFAAAFLMPKHAFLRDVECYGYRLNYYIDLKKKWNVSMAAMIVRAYNLCAITANQYQYLMRQLSKNGWRTCEPLDEDQVESRPTALRQAVELLKNKKGLSGNEIMQVFSNNGITLSPRMAEELLMLDAGTLAPTSEQSKVIPFVSLKKI